MKNSLTAFLSMTSIILIPFLPALGFAQLLEKVEMDRFTGQKRILSKWTNVIKGGENIENIYLRSVDTTIFISITGTLGVGTIGLNDAAVFLFDDKSTFSIYPTSIQSYDPTGPSPKYNQQYFFSKKYLEKLTTNILVAIRRNYNDAYVDIDVDEEKKEGIKNVAVAFLEELNKN